LDIVLYKHRYSHRTYTILRFSEICSQDLEGIVAKRKLSIYKPGGNGWLKIKNKSYTQTEGRLELLTNRKRVK